MPLFNLLKEKLNLKEGLESHEIRKGKNGEEATQKREQKSQVRL